jgi:hypothetical protein
LCHHIITIQCKGASGGQHHLALLEHTPNG